jgi:hypothetical protein
LDENILPQRHVDPWVDLLRGYISQAVEVLSRGGLHIEGSWLDPCGPRDATVLYSSSAEPKMALVWDEATGWRRGHFVGGRQGVRTLLGQPVYLGGGVMLDPRELTHRVTNGAPTQRNQYRSHTDLRDGLDDALAGVPYTLRN